MIREIVVPMEQWFDLHEMNSTQRVVESRACPAGVCSKVYRGELFTCFGILWRGLSSSSGPIITAYRLLPEEIFRGETTEIYHDAEAIANGLRKRGDHTGLVVLVSGRRFVCAEKIHIRGGLPSVAMSLAEAKAASLERNGFGWQSRFGDGRWYSHQGHPVEVYESAEDGRAAMLFWRYGDKVETIYLGEDLELESADLCVGVERLPAASVQVRDDFQLGLF